MVRISLMALACAALAGCAGVQTGASEQFAGTEPARVDFNSCAKPVYPPEALAAKRTGTVTLGFLVALDGTVADTKVMRSSGQRDLDETARDAIKLCKFTPAMKNGSPVQEWTPVQYVWVLN